MYTKVITSVFFISLILSSILSMATCLEVVWDVPAKVVPGQSIGVKVRLMNKCKTSIRIDSFEAKVVRVKPFDLLDIPLGIKVMSVSYAEGRVVPPNKALTLSSAKMGIPWYAPPGMYVFNLLVRTVEGITISNKVNVRIVMTGEYELALTFIALLVIGALMLSLPYGKEVRIRVRRKVSKEERS